MAIQQNESVCAISALHPYPMDMSQFLVLPLHQSGGAGRGPWGGAAINQAPTEDAAAVAQYALAHWNLYLETNEEQHRLVFLAQARWLVAREMRIGGDTVGWPILLADTKEWAALQPAQERREDDGKEGRRCLSAVAQGCVLSVLVRAYGLTHEEVFLETAHYTVRTFERDILDGGVSASVGSDGIFFEEVAAYPAAHSLPGLLFALFGLYDYVALSGDAHVEQLIACGLRALHELLGEFDTGFWTRANLLSRRLASPDELALQTMLLEALAKETDCEQCMRTALRWKGYQQQWSARLRYRIRSWVAAVGRRFGLWVRGMVFPLASAGSSSSTGTDRLHVCIPVTSFPFTGGILTVLEGIAGVMQGSWQIEYLAHFIGPDRAKYVVHRFGGARTAPWHFPFVWLHVLAGAKKLVALLRGGAEYSVIMPQDGLFTAAFSVLVGKLAGIRVICIDHSTLTWPTNPLFRAERIEAIRRKPWHPTMRLLVLLMLQLYWPSLALLARFSARFVDHFLIPGVPGDEIEDVCRRIGVPQSRLTRFASMIDVRRHTVFDTETRAHMRELKGMDADDIVVAIICRLEAEKGLEVAIESIHRALTACSSEVRSRLRVVIAGDGLLRKQLEEDIAERGLSQTCVLWGDIPAEEVIALLGISDIFLYTSTRGACFPMAVLEAMASGCAVIASTQPIANAHLLAEGRGIAVSPGDAEQAALALEMLMNDLMLCRYMGKQARKYIALHHSPDTFQRTLMQITYWSAFDEILANGKRLGALRGVKADDGRIG